MRRVPVRTCVGALLVAAGLGGCVPPAINLTDPHGPRYGTSGRTERSALVRATPARLTVVTFNIKYGRRVDRAIEVLRSPPLRTADVISLQEIDDEDAARIAEALHMEYVYYPASVHPVEGVHYGSAVLSAWPIERDWKLILPYHSWWRDQQRAATAAVLRVGDVRVRIYATHVELPFSITPAGRTDQIEHILCDAAGAGEPVIIAGDFNGPDIAFLFERAGYAWTTRDVGPTATVFRADHIFARGLELDAPDSAGVVAEVRGSSDHHPVWALLRFADTVAARAQSLESCTAAEHAAYSQGSSALGP